jgi:hypothetical protein
MTANRIRASQKASWHIVSCRLVRTTMVTMVDPSVCASWHAALVPARTWHCISVAVGGQGAEYDEKPSNVHLELRGRYYLQL